MPGSGVGEEVGVLGAAGAIGAFPQRCSSKIDIDKFRHGTDDFTEWVEELETVISLATNATGQNLDYLCKKWLPIKLDQASKAIYKRVDANLSWDELKKALAEKLIDPHQEYMWQAMKYTVKWDGKESFHALASRVIQAVATYQSTLTQDQQKEQHFFRFREALPEVPYQEAIDMGIKKADRTLENAVDIAQRTRMTKANREKAVTFGGAAMEENRQSSLDMTLSKMNSNLESLTYSVNNKFKEHDDRFDKLEKAQTDLANEFRGMRKSLGMQSPRPQSPRNFGGQDMQGPPLGQSPHSWQPGSGYAGQGQSFQQNFFPLSPCDQGYYYSNQGTYTPNRGGNQQSPRSGGRPRPNQKGGDKFNAIQTDDEDDGEEDVDKEEVGD